MSKRRLILNRNQVEDEGGVQVIQTFNITTSAHTVSVNDDTDILHLTGSGVSEGCELTIVGKIQDFDSFLIINSSSVTCRISSPSSSVFQIVIYPKNVLEVIFKEEGVFTNTYPKNKSFRSVTLPNNSIIMEDDGGAVSYSYTSFCQYYVNDSILSISIRIVDIFSTGIPSTGKLLFRFDPAVVPNYILSNFIGGSTQYNTLVNISRFRGSNLSSEELGKLTISPRTTPTDQELYLKQIDSDTVMNAPTFSFGEIHFTYSRFLGVPSQFM